MAILHIEHPVPDWASWKAAFDGDPADRAASGVRSYRVFRPVDDPNYIAVDLDFETADEAAAFLARMRAIWAGAGARVSSDQQARIYEEVERVDL